jgi:hypothetical protein
MMPDNRGVIQSALVENLCLIHPAMGILLGLKILRLKENPGVKYPGPFRVLSGQAPGLEGNIPRKKETIQGSMQV